MNINESENEHGEYYKNVLENQKIELESFEKFRKFLENSKLRSFYKSEKYSIFIVDGFMDNSWGYLYNHSNEKIKEEYLEINGYYIKITENLKDNWYRIRID